MSKVALCDGQLQAPIREDPGEKHQDVNAMWGERPTKVKRKRIRCPKCGRKLWSSVKLCHDNCCLLHTLPPHKPKGWWKRKGK